MDWSRLSVWVGIFLILPQLTFGADLSKDEGMPGIFKPVSEEPEIGTSFEKEAVTAGEMFGGRQGYIHPFLSVGSYFTSNIFNTSEDERNDTVLVVSPGIWLALPASRQRLLQVETLNTAPGGLAVSRFRTDVDRRFQAYALYSGEFQENNNFDQAATDDHRVEGLLLYNFRGGLSVELANIYENDHDPFSTGDAVKGQLDTFKANLFNPSVSFKVSPKTRVRLDYAWYVLDYDSPRRDHRDREDHAFSGYVFYRFTPKTSAFLDYEYIAKVYDNNGGNDNHENRFFGGLQWKVTDKSRGRLKLGYGEKAFEGSDEERKFFAAEIQMDHSFTRKTSVFLKASSRASESDIQGTRDVLSHRLRLGYSQNLTAKVTGKIKAFYYRKEYDGKITEEGKIDERTDDKYGGEIALGVSPKRWFNLSGGYVYTERDSNFDNRDYRDHTVFLNVTAAL